MCQNDTIKLTKDEALTILKDLSRLDCDGILDICQYSIDLLSKKILECE